MAAIFEITDGSITVDLINGAPGIHLQSWRPSIPGFKGGGSYQDSALTFGRRLIDRQFTNYIETLTLSVDSTSQDTVIQVMQEIRRLLDKAATYWTADWQNEPVWIRAKASNETNIRYSIVVSGRIEEDENPFAQPFLQPGCNAIMNGLTLIIEHEFWSDTIPGSSSVIELSAVEDFDGRSYGTVDDSQDEEPVSTGVYVGNKRVLANITDVYVDNGGVFGANLLDAALPYSLLPAVPVQNDAVYFGCDTTLAGSGPFYSLVFDLSQVSNIGAVSYDWEYWDGGAWQDMATADEIWDNSNGLNVLGEVSVHWIQHSDWATTTVNGVTGYWVRYNIDGVPGAPQAAIQQNRNVYSIVWPYVEVASTEVLGDLAALTNIGMVNVSSGDPEVGPLLFDTIVLMGMRSLSRGEDFTAYLNFSSDQNSADVSFITLGGPAFVTNLESPTGDAMQYTSDAGGNALVRMDITGTLVQEYFGRYQMFLIGQRTGGDEEDLGIQLEVIMSGGANIYSSEIKYFTGTTAGEVISFGKLDARSKFGSLDISTLQFNFNIIDDTAVGTVVDLFYFVLMPVDEWAIEVGPTADGFADLFAGEGDETRKLNIDSITIPKKDTIAYLRNSPTTTDVISVYYTKTARDSILPANVAARLWWFMRDGVFEETPITTSGVCIFVDVNTKQRYYSMRGDR